MLERKDGKSACQKEASEWRSRWLFPLSSSYVKVWNSHSIREHSSWYKRCWLLIPRTVPSWYSASLHRAAVLKIPRILPSVYLSVMKQWGYFSVQSSRGGKGLMMRSAEASNKCLLPGWISMSWWVWGTPWTLITDKSSSRSQPLIGFFLLCRVGVHPPQYVAELRWIFNLNFASTQ